MTRGRDGNAQASPAKHRALIAAIVVLILALSSAIYAATASDDGTARGPVRVAPGHPRGEGGVAPASTGVWAGAWAAAPAAAEPGTEETGVAGRSVRNVVHSGVGGTGARVTLSNLYGQSPLTISHASVALAAGGGAPTAVATSMRRLTFAGSAAVVIPPGGQVMSDAARIPVPYGGDVLVTTYSPTPSGPVTYHPRALQTSFLAEGDRTEDTAGAAYTERTPYWRYLTALDVLTHEADGTVVAFGDSITDGYGSTPDANRRWPDVFGTRLRAAAGHKGGDGHRDVPRYSVVNGGISGNRVLTSKSGRPADNPSGLSRFSRDVLGRTNVRAVVIALGVNDILHSPELADRDSLLAGLRTMADEARSRGLRVVGATVTPFGGYGGYTEAREALRQEINAEIRSGRVFDAVVDFDRALRDPADPRRLRAEYDSGDHLHPGDRGYARMAETLDPRALLKEAPRAQL
ncbi:SGNH/GDSL hydrolase family protein [Streptomyces sp. SHP 1-2]|uniref:SGNH/GDSL hydrolase family protein n=1 Tax=Streptomyces sp. SHP 1-2 TaxID=2769489 RepID=UPI0022381634|nr:SGNH/GDSL hydrolase family protein [Streptomyces sp. SHP 1-2]MCW5252685.1 SGNH/GDSL hydrolase family protein [Streptomyces sp. SHP 1-2]